ncbi:hypothetical protein EFL26_14635 [Nocardioides pocheonensis]|uniref:Uncharacterized protein n=1 Tax=Nocardioides pocheonensis TaxID=661485 RepID=A0A3N0GPX6_9ACTN|nr:hypothetical protein EFL26_14635 [Nocardioides pocheonensis]
MLARSAFAQTPNGSVVAGPVSPSCHGLCALSAGTWSVASSRSASGTAVGDAGGVLLGGVAGEVGDSAGEVEPTVSGDAGASGVPPHPATTASAGSRHRAARVRDGRCRRMEPR